MNSANISIVITCFNYAQYVVSAIESAIRQAYMHKEIIVVNDGSTDNSSEVIIRYADRMRIIEQPNLGSIAAYNRGFEESTGNVVVFLDADDLLAENALEEIASAWYPECAKVQYDLKIINGGGEDLGRRFCNFAPNYDVGRVRADFLRTGTYRWPVTTGNAYSRWFLETVIPLQVDQGPDGLLNTVAPVYGDVVTISEVLGSYRLHGSNLWSSIGSDRSQLPARIETRQREVAFMREHAARRNVALPPGNVLDHEMAFINYRLMALKLGLDYPGRGNDTCMGLFRSACRVLLRQWFPFKLWVSHFAWFVILVLSRRSIVGGLFHLRFNRAAYVQVARRAACVVLDPFKRFR